MVHTLLQKYWPHAESAVVWSVVQLARVKVCGVKLGGMELELSKTVLAALIVLQDSGCPARTSTNSPMTRRVYCMNVTVLLVTDPVQT